MEHEQAEQEHEQAQEQAEELEGKAEELDERKDEFGEQVKDLKQDWEQKQQAADVPGAQEKGKTLSMEREESDQLPEEGPDDQVVDDDGRAGARGDTEDNPGHPGEEERATGSQPDERDGEDDA